MKTYSKINFSEVSSILMQVAQGISYTTGCKLIVSDMVYSLNELSRFYNYGNNEPFYIAIRETGTEGGCRDYCISRCEGLGYPLVIAKITPLKFDFDMTVMLTHNWMSGDNNSMKQEFDSL